MKLGIIIASTRPGRTSPKVAQWLFDAVSAHQAVEPEILDLLDFDLPLFDEPKHPRLGNYAHAHTLRWAEAVGRNDAFVVVTPEYNHMPPSSLVNAVTFLGPEWGFKPVAIASYGGVSGGLRAAQQLKLLLLAVKAVPISEGLIIPTVAKQVVEGAFVPNELQIESADTSVAALVKWNTALAQLRTR